MNTTETKYWVLGLLARLLGKDVKLSDSIFSVAEWDSAVQVEIIFYVEEYINKELTEKEMESLVTVQSIVDFIERNL